MSNKRHLWSAALIAFLLSFLVARVALAEDEVECNNPVLDANGAVALDANNKPFPQPLVFDSSGTVEVNGAIVNGLGYNPCSAPPNGRDIDYYTFQAKAGDVLNIAILNAYDDTTGTGTWIDLAVFGPYSGDPYHMYNETVVNPQYDQGPSGGPAPGFSASQMDPAIPNFTAQETGTYYIGISSVPGQFDRIDHVTSDNVTSSYSAPPGVVGSYTLSVWGATPSVVQINIDIRPGRRDVIWSATAVREYSGRGQDTGQDDRSGPHHELEGLRHRFKHGLPVALLSSDSFDAMDVDQSTLRFGSKGDEDSLMRCNRHGVDVNHDKKPDLVCWFDFTKSDFVPGDNQGVVTGSTNSGVDFEGTGVLKMVTGMPRPPHHDRDRDHGHRHRR